MITQHDSYETPVHVASEEEVAEAVQRALDAVELTHSELEAQARQGRFDTELARRTWFCIPRHEG